MTREEAITVLKAFMGNPLFNDEHKQAFNIAIHDIKAYQDWNINNLILVNKDNYEPLEQESNCSENPTSSTTKKDLAVDCISRKAALDITWHDPSYSDPLNVLTEVRDKIRELPSVTPQEPRWIPVSEKLPKEFESVDCTCHSLIDDREDWVIETVYMLQPPNSPYSDWGNIPMLNKGDCKVVAWVHRDIPEPYKPESEVEDGNVN